MTVTAALLLCECGKMTIDLPLQYRLHLVTRIRWAAFIGAFLMPGVLMATSLSLDELLSQAMVSYPTILSKQSNQEAAQSDLTASKLRFLPAPSISSQRNQMAYNDGVSMGGNRSASTIGLNQPIFMGGGLLAAYDRASARLSAADYALLETREDVSKRLITTYAEWFRAYRKILALDDSVRLHEKFAGLITRRAEGGVASGVDRDLGVSRLFQARADLETQISAEKTALSTLSQMVGYPLERSNLVGRIAAMAAVPTGSDVLEKIILNSPAIARAKFEAEAAEAEAREARASALPQVSFQAQRQYGNPYVPGAPGYDLLGFVVQYSPGSGLASFATTGAAFSRARSAAEMVEATKRELTSTWSAEFNEYQYSKLKADSLKDSAGLSVVISDSYDRQYLVGRKSWIDLMNAVREQTQTRMALVDAQASALGASRRLQVIINGTLDFDYMKQASSK